MATVLEPTTLRYPRSSRRQPVLRRPTKTPGLLGLDHHRRPQAHRHPLRRHRVRVLPLRRRRGAADPAAAGPAERHVPVRRPLQPAVHDARHHDDLPRGHADLGGVLQLLRADHDRRPRRRLPAPQRVQLLDVPVRRHVHQLELLPRRRAQRRLVRLRAEHVDRVLARATTSTSGSSACRSSVSRRRSVRSTSSSPSSTCGRRAWSCSACRCSCG